MFGKILVCVSCGKSLTRLSSRWYCKRCRIRIPIIKGIPDFIHGDSLSVRTAFSLEGYNKSHARPWIPVTDGSYEILAAFARGNPTVDIACGEGLLERLAPETVGVDFSMNALLKAKKRGGKYFVLSDAHRLPFRDSSFRLSICAGSLEHFASPLAVVKEMARVSQIQILTVHKPFPIIGANIVRKYLLRWKGIVDQPIDQPMSLGELKRLIREAHLNLVFSGVWHYPFSFGLFVKRIPHFLSRLPSCHFVITIRKNWFQS